ncbi:MAG TPA: hypothetical protein VM686_41495 [Polyangiaceae bacterium]|nr:hypothetical protein [Polyangiaceae bacterium]
MTSGYAAHVVFRRYSLLLVLLALCASGCQRKDKKRAPQPARTYQRPPPRPIPPEPAFQPHELEVADSGFPCEVEAALKAKCRRCHTTPARHGAPFPLLSWEQTQADFRGTPVVGHIGRAVKSGFMPYRIKANPEVEPLTDAEKQAIVSWAESGAPRASCDPVAVKKSNSRPAKSKAKPKASL